MTALTTEYLREYLDQKLQEQLDKTKEYINTLVDSIDARITALESNMNLRFSFVDAELADIKSQLKEVSKRDIEDSNALYKSVAKLQKRIDVLEAQVKKLKISQPSK